MKRIKMNEGMRMKTKRRQEILHGLPGKRAPNTLQSRQTAPFDRSLPTGCITRFSAVKMLQPNSTHLTPWSRARANDIFRAATTGVIEQWTCGLALWELFWAVGGLLSRGCWRWETTKEHCKVKRLEHMHLKISQRDLCRRKSICVGPRAGHVLGSLLRSVASPNWPACWCMPGDPRHCFGP